MLNNLLNQKHFMNMFSLPLTFACDEDSHEIADEFISCVSVSLGKSRLVIGSFLTSLRKVKKINACHSSLILWHLY